MNLITEYQRRHEDKSIPLCHDGVCFFELEEAPALIALTSLSCRSFSTCGECDDSKNSNVIVEFFMAGPGGSFVPAGHYHVDPCGDLLKFMKTLGYPFAGRQYIPYYASSCRDLETWLWKFCTLQNRFRYKSSETDKQLKTVEQMVYAVQKHPKLYQAYFIAYEAFLLNRKYLLFDGLDETLG